MVMVMVVVVVVVVGVGDADGNDDTMRKKKDDVTWYTTPPKMSVTQCGSHSFFSKMTHRTTAQHPTKKRIGDGPTTRPTRKMMTFIRCIPSSSTVEPLFTYGRSERRPNH
jgi:hypothetical protein